MLVASILLNMGTHIVSKASVRDDTFSIQCLVGCRHPSCTAIVPSLRSNVSQALHQPQDDSNASAASDIMRSRDPAPEEAIDVAGTKLLAQQGEP